MSGNGINSSLPQAGALSKGPNQGEFLAGERGWILSRLCWKKNYCSHRNVCQDLNRQWVSLVCPPGTGISVPGKGCIPPDCHTEARLDQTDVSHSTAEAQKYTFLSQAQPWGWMRSIKGGGSTGRLLAPCVSAVTVQQQQHIRALSSTGKKDWL